MLADRSTIKNLAGRYVIYSYHAVKNIEYPVTGVGNRLVVRDHNDSRVTSFAQPQSNSSRLSTQ